MERWLVVVGALLTGFGVLMALASGTPLFDPLNRLIDPAFWPSGPPEHGTVAFRSWVYGVWGATIAGWGAVLLVLVREVFGRRGRWAWWALASGITAWFTLDTGPSLVHGVAFNVALNLVVLVLFGIPLLATRSLAWGQPRRGD